MFSRFRERLLQWFDISARRLPWRGTDDPYRVWVSEIMLQQTQVETVIPYFERWIGSFPTVTALAAADEATVLKHWEGLGYYRRARMLHRAAQQVVSEFGGVVPLDPRLFSRLSGVGRYTTGAVLSISQNIRLPIVEANTVRLYARLMALSEDPTTSESQKKLWTFAEQLLPEESEERDGKNPYPYGRLNQSLMELGSLVCTPRAPRCGDCPVAHVCKTNQLGGNAVSRIPVVKAKPTVQPVREAALLIYRPMEPKLDSEISTTPRDRNVFLVRRRTSRERWSGLWDFPRFPVGELCDRPLFDYLRSQFTSVTKEDSEWCETSFTFSSRTGEIEPIMNLADRLVFDTLEPMKILRHSVTRYSITLEVYLARISSRVVLSNPTLRLPRMKGKRPAQRTLFSEDDGDNRFESAKWPNLPSHLARVLSPEPGTASVPLLSSIPTNSPGTTFPMGTEWSWMTLEQLEQAPMHTTARKMTTLAVVLERMPLPPS